MAQIVLTGSAELNAKLASLKGPKAKQAIRKASRDALRPVAEAAKGNINVRSGKLRRSIRVRAITRSRSRVGARVTTSATDNLFKGKTFYGGFIEYGWKAGRRVRNADLGVGKRKRRTAAQTATAEAKNNSRKRIEGQQPMKRAAREKKALALTIYYRETARWIRELSQSK